MKGQTKEIWSKDSYTAMFSPYREADATSD